MAIARNPDVAFESVRAHIFGAETVVREADLAWALFEKLRSDDVLTARFRKRYWQRFHGRNNLERSSCWHSFTLWDQAKNRNLLH